MRKFKHRLFNITLEEIPYTGMSVLYSVSYGNIKSKDIVNAFFVHGSNLFEQIEGDPIKGMDYIGTKKTEVVRRFKHIASGRTYLKCEGGWYNLEDRESIANSVPAFVVESGSDWEEIKEKKEYPIGTKVYNINRGASQSYYIKEEEDIWKFIQNDKRDGTTILSFNEDLIGTKFILAEKSPVRLITSDGVEMRDGDTCWYARINPSDYTDNNFKICEKTIPNPSFIYFSKEEVLNKYLSRNKVLFITEDGVGIKEGETFHLVSKENPSRASMKIVTRLNTKVPNGFIAYRDILKANEYVETHEKKYSIQDIYDTLGGIRQGGRHLRLEYFIDKLKNK